MQTKLQTILNTVTPLSEASINQIFEAIEYSPIKKGVDFIKVGAKNNFEYFILEGVCKSFLRTQEGDEVTISFFMEDSILSPATTRNKNGESLLHLRALTDMNVAIINADTFENMMVTNLEIRNFGNTVLQLELMQKVQKEIALATLKGKDKLKYLRQVYPNIENLVSHADIASFLGLTTISLSRLRTQS